MGPKRARLVSSSSSSSSSSQGEDVVDHTKFVNLDAQMEYYRIMAKTFVKERGFKPEQQDGQLCNMIHEREWLGLTATPMPASMGIVREFYANTKETMSGLSVIHGVQVDFRPPTIRAVFRLLDAPPIGSANWVEGTHLETDLEMVLTELCVPGTKWTYKADTNQPRIFPASALNRYAKAWNLFICAKLVPSSHQHEITAERAIILWGIITGKYIDVAHLIHQNMLRYMRGSTTGSIPHASVVASLCAQQGVYWDNEQMQNPSQDITHATIAKFEDWAGGAPHRRGKGFIIQPTFSEPPP